MSPGHAVQSTLSGPRGILLPFLFACGAFLLLHGRSLVGPVLFYDDFPIFVQARTWQRTCAAIWLPQNEHVMPLGRLFSFGLAWLAGSLPRLPFFTCLVGPAALLFGVWLLYVFIRRELGHPFYALVAIVLFSVTTVYHQAVWWFAASFAVLSLDTMLLALLAAQRWRQTGRGLYLDLAVLACFLAPGWFAIGILAGPLCCLYLLPRASSPTLLPSGEKAGATGHWTLLPLAGTVLYLAIILPRTAQTILHTGHYGDQTALESFQPWIGLEYTARSLVDNLLLGVVGVANVALPLRCLTPIFSAVVVAGVWWWRQARDHRLMLLGLGLIVSSYLLCYSARATWDYDVMVEPHFARYHLLPHLGLVLFFCGGLPGRAGHWFSLAASRTITARQRRFLCWLIAVCFLVQLPRGLLCASPTGLHQVFQVGWQQDVLGRIEEVDARCRQYHISAKDAREVLGGLYVPSSHGVIHGCELLAGSDDPQPLPREEIQRLLNAP